MSLERLGIVEQRQADRVTFARFFARPDRVAVKSHTITVDCARPDERIVESGDTRHAPPPIAAKPRKKVRRRLDPDDLPPTMNRVIRASRYSVRQILEAVAASYNLPVYALVSATRAHRVARPRFAAALLLREKRYMSSKRIGHALKRDHTTALHEVRRAKWLLLNDTAWAANYHAAELLLSKP